MVRSRTRPSRCGYQCAAGRGRSWRAFARCPGTSYVGAIIVLYLVTFVLGAWIYTQYRFTARPALEQLRFFKTVGVFEMKEHLATISLVLLPAYWAFWRRPLAEAYSAARRQLTLFLAVLVWANFLIGHIANNARGSSR